MRRMVCALCALLSFVVSAAMPTITGVTAQQRYPWNGKVDISYTVSGDIAAEAKLRCSVASLKVKATDRATGMVYAATQLSGDMSLTAGTHSIVWDMDAEGCSFKSSNVVFSVTCETTPATYCIIHLNNGTHYQINYLAEPPSGGFNSDGFKTTTLALRRVEAGTYKMQNVADVTLTQAFYIGIFEVTQRQYSYVMGNNPASSYSSLVGDKRPVSEVSYNSLTSSSSDVSFIRRLSERTGNTFSLPTEAQWEYACRAGTSSRFNNGGNSMETDLKLLGRYLGNRSDGRGGGYKDYVNVGSYLPNAWGLYDMHGNVGEWCLDRLIDTNSLPYGTDPYVSKGGNLGSRVYRGGSFDEDGCSSFDRRGWLPEYGENNIGFRIIMIPPNMYQPE